MKIKGLLTLGVSACLLFGGCSLPLSPEKEEEKAKQQEEGTSDAQGGAGNNSWSSLERIAYYETMLQELNEELLALKTQLYAARVEYESELESLKAEYESQAVPQVPFAYTVSNRQVTVTAYLGQDREVIVPKTIDGMPVVEIADRAFQNHKSLRAVKLPDGIRQIGWFAFSGCALLETVFLPTDLEVICYGAFENCSSNMVVHCQKGSYAEQYAKSYGMRVSYTEG